VGAGRIARTALISGTLTGNALSGWNPGPLPLEVRSPDHAALANLAGRSSLLDRHAVLLTLEGSRVRRFWRWLDEPAAQQGYWAAEISLLDSVSAGRGESRCCLVLHQTVADLDDLASVAAAFQPVDSELIEGLVPGLKRRIRRGRPAEYNLRLMISGDGLDSMLGGSTHITGREQWLWSLASGTLPKQSPAADLVPGHRRVDISADLFRSEARADDNLLTWSSDWEALVLRDGTGFVGYGPDTTGHIEEWTRHEFLAERDATLLDFAELYMRTVYADVFMIGEFQRWGLADLSAAAVDQPTISAGSNLKTVRRLDSDLANFRRWDWWDSVASSGPADAMLKAYQQQHQLPRILERCTSDVHDASRIAAEEADQRLSGALAVISTIGLPVAACLAGADLLASPDQDGWDRILTLGLGLLASGVLSAILLLAFPGLRSALRDSFYRGR
jgi:hypothetical protein